MGFIKAAFTSLKEVWHDGKFIEFVAIPETIDSDVVAIKGTLHITDPDGVRRQSNNKTTGLISDGSLIFVPQGYVAIAVSNGEILTDMAYLPGIYKWDTGQNKTLFFDDEGFFKGIRSSWNQFKERFKLGGQTSEQQEIVYIKMQPIIGVKFGTSGGVEFMSPTYRNLSIRFYGVCDIAVDDPVTFFVQIVSRKIGESGVYKFSEIGETLRKHLPTNIGVALSKYAIKEKCEVPQMNAILLEVGSEVAETITQSWSTIYGLGLKNVLIEDISYDENSQKIVNEYDELLRKAYDPRIVQYEGMHRHFDVMDKMAANEAKGESFNSLAGIAMVPTMMGMVGGAMSQQMPNAFSNQQNGFVTQNPVNPQTSVTPQSANPVVATQVQQEQPSPATPAQPEAEDAWNALKQQMETGSTEVKEENNDPLGLLDK